MIVKTLAVLAAMLALVGCATSTDGTPHRLPQTTQASPTPGSTAASGTPSAPSTGAATPSPAQTSPATALDESGTITAAVSAAQLAFAAISAFDYRTLDADLSKALAYTTGQFATSYRSAFTAAVEPEARRRKLRQTAAVVAIGVQHVDSPTAVRLLLVDRFVTTPTGKAATRSIFRATVTMTLVADRWKVSAVSDAPLDVGPPAGTAAIGAAISGARAAAGALLTLRRASFAADYARQLSLTTGELHRELAGRESADRELLRVGKYDLGGRATAAAIVSVSPSGVLVLLSSSGFRVSGGRTVGRSAGQFELTMTQVDGRWLASTLTTVQ